MKILWIAIVLAFCTFSCCAAFSDSIPPKSVNTNREFPPPCNECEDDDDIVSDDPQPKVLFPPCEYYAPNNETVFKYPSLEVEAYCIPLGMVKFSQASVSAHTSSGKLLDDVIKKFEKFGYYHKKKLPDMVKWKDELYQTADNRRIYCARKAGLAFVPARVHGIDESLPKEELFRFRITVMKYGRTVNKHAATWGEGLAFRGIAQKGDFPFYGTSDLPVVLPSGSLPPTPQTSGPEAADSTSAYGCAMCKLMVQEIDNYLADSKTQLEIVQWLEGKCSTLGSHASTCRVLVANFGFQLIDRILNEETPDKACAQVGLCATTAIPFEEEQD